MENLPVRAGVVFRGMAPHEVEPTIEQGPRLRQQNHIDRPACCTSRQLDIAQTFAIRRTPDSDYDEHGHFTGKVVEFVLFGESPDDWEEVRDTSAMHDEGEVAVYNPECLTAVAVWESTDPAGIRWERRQLEPTARPPLKRMRHAGATIGRSRDRVTCAACGYQRDVYVWSWAGNGFYKCPGCGTDVLYMMGATGPSCPRCGSFKKRKRLTDYGDYDCEDCGQHYNRFGRRAIKHGPDR